MQNNHEDFPVGASNFEERFSHVLCQDAEKTWFCIIVLNILGRMFVRPHLILCIYRYSQLVPDNFVMIFMDLLYLTVVQCSATLLCRSAVLVRLAPCTPFCKFTATEQWHCFPKLLEQQCPQYRLYDTLFCILFIFIFVL